METQEELTDDNQSDISLAEQFSARVLLKAAKIINVEKHPGGTQLYILTLDAGDPEPRQIVSSIVSFYKEESLLGKTIVLVYNLKPANFRGVRSNGMLLAASDPAVKDTETCEVLFVPQFEPGTILEPEGFPEPDQSLCYVKPDKFFSIPLYTKDGFMEVGGKKIGSCGKYVTAQVYRNGSVG